MIKLPVIHSNDDLFLFLLHLVGERFKDNAVLKGGMVLRLLGSKRHTLDLDYTFIPFTSKNEILSDIKQLFSEVDGLQFRVSVNSKAIRINIVVEQFRSQVEINVAEELKTDVISTAHLKNESNSISPRVIRIMSLDIALAHKLAAWNERRLFRDLYDAYYFLEVQKIYPNIDVLKSRLSNIQSRKPELRKTKSIDLDDFVVILGAIIDELSQKDLDDELSPLIDELELQGLALKMKSAFHSLLSWIRSTHLS